MKLNSLMKKCSTVTVTDGWCQAVDKSIAFIEYLPKASGLNFSVDAKAFIDAINTLATDYHISVSDDCVRLFDEEQIVTLLQQPADISVVSKVISANKWLIYDFASVWAAINDFADAAYPAIRCTKGYLETLTNESITRIDTARQLPITEVKTLVSYKLPKHSEAVSFQEDSLWIKYKSNCFIGLSYIDTRLPNTDSFFETWDIGKPIPIALHQKITQAEVASFTNEGLKLSTEKIADTVIEGIEGYGKYSYKPFSKGIKHGLTWAFQKKYMCITGQNLKVVLENLDA